MWDEDELDSYSEGSTRDSCGNWESEEEKGWENAEPAWVNRIRRKSPAPLPDAAPYSPLPSK